MQRHRNRELPPLEPAASAEDYARRIREADAHIRSFIRAHDILTIPEYVAELDTNVPWMVRPGGRNVWKRSSTATQRGLGLRPRGDVPAGRPARRPPPTKELFYIFQVKRAVRNRAELRMQFNEWTVDEAVRDMVEHTPFLDKNVARVDAEIYLRRPPGYGLSYQLGKLQMDQLLADRSRQLGDRFSLRAFHDEFLATGTIPIALTRYEMTGLADDVQDMFVPPPPSPPR